MCKHAAEFPLSTVLLRLFSLKFQKIKSCPVFSSKMSLKFSSSSKTLGSRKCLYCGDNKQYAQVLRIPENASALPKWIERFGNLFFYQIALVHKTLRFVCERHLREVQDRKRDTIDMQMLKSWPQIRFKTVCFPLFCFKFFVLPSKIKFYHRNF